MNCLVTGASGFIGNALVHRLCNEQHNVIGLIHHHDPPEKHPQATYITDDIVHPGDKLKESCKTVDVVFHCAAFVKDYGPKKWFYDINVKGTKNLIELCNQSINRFIYLSHIPYEKVTVSNYYNKTKTMAESMIIHNYKENGFPATILRPGNVYGPGATTWVLRPIESIMNDRIALIDQGSGIFLHTYIDNLLDALVASSTKNDINGKCIDITDGDYSITWGRYLNDLANMVQKGPIERNLSKRTALIVGKLMISLHRIFRITPWVTPQAVLTFTNNKTVSIKEAERLLDYNPKVDYEQGIKKVKIWVDQNKELIMN